MVHDLHHLGAVFLHAHIPHSCLVLAVMAAHHERPRLVPPPDPPDLTAMVKELVHYHSAQCNVFTLVDHRYHEPDTPLRQTRRDRSHPNQPFYARFSHSRRRW
ncbi:MAG: hypothetical protein V4662_12025 [Verrucomicrobiota bacterium]